MSGDYKKGYSGQPRDESTNEAEYWQGRNDRAEGRPEGGGPSAMGGAAYADSVEARQRWDANPGKQLRSMLFRVARWTVGAGLIGAGVAFVFTTWLDPRRDRGTVYPPVEPVAVAVLFAGVAFFLIGALTWSQLLGFTIGGKSTLGGCLVWLALTAVLGLMLWTFVFHGLFVRIGG